MALLHSLSSRAVTLAALSSVVVAAAGAVSVACNSKTDDVPLTDITGNGTPAGSSGTGAGTGTDTGDAAFGDGGVVSVVDSSFAGTATDASVATFANFTCAGRPVALVASGNALYASCTSGEIYAIASDGSATLITQLARGGALAPNGNILYAIVPGSTATSSDGNVVSIDLTTFAQTTLATALVGPSSLVTNAAGVVWTDAAGGMINVVEATVPGDTLTVLNTFGSGRAAGLLYIDSSGEFFTDTATGSGDIYTGTGNGAAGTLLATLTGTLSSLIADAANLYFTTSDTGTVNSVSRAGSAVKILSSVEADPVGLQLINGSLYWANASTGHLQTYNLTTSTEGTVGTGFVNAVTTAVSDGLYVLLASSVTSTGASGSVVRVAF